VEKSSAFTSTQLLPLLMVEGCVGRSWAVWSGAMGFADELPMYGVLRSSSAARKKVSKKELTATARFSTSASARRADSVGLALRVEDAA
jgi:hypothetical protein